MNILFDIAHPADVHLFRNVRRDLIDQGHKVLFLARDKDVVLDLLNAYQIPYINGTKSRKGFIRLCLELIAWFFNSFHIIRKEKIDIAVSLSSASTAWAAKFNRVPHIMFNDTETGKMQLRLARPATKWIYTPECLLAEWGPKQIRYNGIHDLAYLHPDCFTPKFPFEKKEDYAILRFVSWNAAHDWRADRTSLKFQLELCKLLTKKMKVYISAEAELPEELKQYKIPLPPERMHDALAFAKIVAGDGATTATEAAVLGVPSIYISPFADSLGYCKLLQEYDLLNAITSEKKCLTLITQILDNPQAKKRSENRKRFLKDHINVTDFIKNHITS